MRPARHPMESGTELLPAPADGRVFEQAVRPGLADCSPSGRVRLDALARWLQDVAYADVEDAGVAEGSVWVIRRSRLEIRRFPRFGERFRVATFCSGLGRMWAERRTTIARGAEATSDVEAVAVWVHLDPASQRPVPLRPAEIETYGAGAARQRRVSARLRHPVPPAEGCAATPWRFRAAEVDLAAHVNNSAYWQPLEEEILAAEEPERLTVEIEFRNPAQPGPVQVLREGDHRWIVGPDGQPHASLWLEPAA